jgi:hypothetical protein
MLFEFLDYGGEVARPVVTVRDLRNESAARSHAGSLAKRNGGPVDVAYHSTKHWEERYVTTAAPSEYHATGYRCERLT